MKHDITKYLGKSPLLDDEDWESTKEEALEMLSELYDLVDDYMANGESRRACYIIGKLEGLLQ